MTEKIVKEVQYKTRLDWMDKKRRRDTELSLNSPKATTRFGTLINDFEVTMSTPLGRYCPNTGRHLTSSEVYKVTKYEDGSSDVKVVIQRLEKEPGWFIRPSKNEFDALWWTFVGTCAAIIVALAYFQ